MLRLIYIYSDSTAQGSCWKWFLDHDMFETFSETIAQLKLKSWKQLFVYMVKRLDWAVALTLCGWEGNQ